MHSVYAASKPSNAPFADSYGTTRSFKVRRTVTLIRLYMYMCHSVPTLAY